MNIFYKVVAFFMSLLMSLFSLVSEKSSLIKSADFSKDSDVMTVDFDNTSVNTVIINMSSQGSANIKIALPDSTVVYNRTGTEKLRYCTFASVQTDSLTITVTGESSALNAEVRYIKNTPGDFRVTSYMIADRITDDSCVSPDSFNVITDVILFGAVRFDEKGVISVDDEVLSTSLSILRKAADGKNVNVYCNVLGPDSDSGETWEEQMYNKADKHNSAFSKSLANGLAQVAEKYGFDGIFFDYEYPLRLEDVAKFSSFIVTMNKLTDVKLGAAVSDWGTALSSPALSALDMIELMQYDLFDEYGHHSSFTTCIDGVDYAKKNLILSKADIGIPFYGRPSDKGGYWPSYAEYAEKLGTSEDGCLTDEDYSYFNCTSTVYDKTAYALDNGAGGVMIWHYSCDVLDMENQLSLFGTIGRCINDRK